METVFLNGSQLQYIELIRVAVSEADNAQRMQAIKNVKHDVVAEQLDLLLKDRDADWFSAQNNADLLAWVAKTGATRHKAVYEISQLVKCFDEKNDRQLSIAEHIGMRVRLSILEEKFEGVQTELGIIQQTRDYAIDKKIYGARDTSTLQEIWGMYRGVVHLGMAMELCEDIPTVGFDVLDQAERIRRDLSENCPRGTSKPYVDPSEQICFVGKSKP